jgi:hypothetical protein
MSTGSRKSVDRFTFSFRHPGRSEAESRDDDLKLALMRASGDDEKVGRFNKIGSGSVLTGRLVGQAVALDQPHL